MIAGIGQSVATSFFALPIVSLVILCSGSSTAAFIKPIRTQGGMVVSAHPLATQAGAEILAAGGNAVDAAVATALAISVVEPFSAGIGGGGFLLYFDAESSDIQALDFRERAPQAAKQDLYLDADGEVISRLSLDGHMAVGVPGTIAGLAAIHEVDGALDWAEVVVPAIALARDGFAVGDRFVGAVEQRWEVLSRNPAALQTFTLAGKKLQLGETLLQPDLAQTLEALAEDAQQFYEGKIAESIVADMTANGGLITAVDLAEYSPVWREPVCGPFSRNHCLFYATPFFWGRSSAATLELNRRS